MAYESIPLGKDFWAIQDGNVRMYLMNTAEQAVLVDTGYGTGDLRSLTEELTGKTPVVIHTHSHGDHTSANGQFHEFYISEGDLEEIRPQCPEDAVIHVIRGGDILRFGDLELEVLDIHGHTPGAVAYLDRGNRRLFSGDSFAKDFPVYMQFPGQDIQAYLDAMLRMQTLQNAYDRICPMHGALEVPKEYMETTIRCARSILDGTAVPGTALMGDGTPSRAAWYEDAAIFY